MSLKESLDLTGRTVIVTGGGRGLGKAMSISLAEAGANVVIASRTRSQLEQAAAEIKEASGHDALIVPTNVQSSAECDALIAAAVSQFGRLDVMLSNAGIGDRRGAGASIYDLADDDWHDTISVNLYSAFYCARAAANQFRKQGPGGNIINVSSGTALRGAPQSLGYAAAKAGVISLTKSLAAMLAGEEIRVNCIVPGYVLQAPPEDDDQNQRNVSRGKFNTVGRIGEAWELGPLAVFLSSDASSYITGETFAIDGGGLAGGIAPTGYAQDVVAGGAPHA